MRADLFIKQDLMLNSGKQSDFKIECDALTDEDISTIAFLMSKKYQFSSVVGVPKGGNRLADALEKYADKNDINKPILIVDDVLTTGGSMDRMLIKVEATMGRTDIIGAVIFSRGECPNWITPLFKMQI